MLLLQLMEQGLVGWRTDWRLNFVLLRELSLEFVHQLTLSSIEIKHPTLTILILAVGVQLMLQL